MSRFRLTIDSTLTQLFVISLVVRGVCFRLGMNAADTSSVDVSTMEAVTNAIKHAYIGAAGHEVSVEFSYTKKRVDLYVRDWGKSMPEEQAAKLRDGSRVLEFDPVDLPAVPEGGMGLQIIHQLMDEVAYSAEGGSNCLRLTKFVRAGDSREAGISN
jgi:serine/threonine-protein kinase RsbW